MSDDDREGLAAILEEVRRIDVQCSRLVTDVMAGGYVSVFRGAGIEFDRVREYADGDDPRKVDWNVTARTGRPFVKEHVDERDLTLLFLLDLSASTSGGWGAWSARRTAARVLACFALAAIRNDDKVGLVAFGSGVEKFVPAGKGAGHALRIVRDCLALPDARGGTDLAPALEFVSHVVRRRAIVFVVSDFLADGWERAMALCARRHDVIAVRLRVPELDPPTAGPMRIRDPETGRESVADWTSAAVRSAYAERVAAWRRRTEDSLARAKVDRMDVDVPRVPGPDSIAGPILRFFRMRELRGAKR